MTKHWQQVHHCSKVVPGGPDCGKCWADYPTECVPPTICKGVGTTLWAQGSKIVFWSLFLNKQSNACWTQNPTQLPWHQVIVAFDDNCTSCSATMKELLASAAIAASFNKEEDSIIAVCLKQRKWLLMSRSLQSLQNRCWQWGKMLACDWAASQTCTEHCTYTEHCMALPTAQEQNNRFKLGFILSAKHNSGSHSKAQVHMVACKRYSVENRYKMCAMCVTSRLTCHSRHWFWRQAAEPRQKMWCQRQ